MNKRVSKAFGVFFLLLELAIVPNAINFMLDQHLSYLSPLRIVALSLTFGSIALCILMSFSSLSDNGSYPKETFLFELTVFMCCIAPMTDLVTNVLDTTGQAALNMAVNTVYYLICINITYVIMMYEFAVIKKKDEPIIKKVKTAALILMIIDNLATLLNIPFGYFFTITESGTYESAPTFWLAYIAPALILGATFIIAAKEMEHGRQRNAFMFFWAFALPAVLLQINAEDLSVQYMGFAMSLVVLYMNVQSELDTSSEKNSAREDS